ncbi:hypothetical protein HKD37_03G006813 [Glycine soja]|nr:hypothetical protein GmHk_03G006844 [Glycine max]
MEESLNSISSQGRVAENQTMEEEVHGEDVSCRQVPHTPSSIFNQLGHAYVVVFLDNLLSVVVHYGCAAVPHDKLLEHGDMTLFERGVESYGFAMVASKCQLAIFALWMAAKPSELR